VTGPAVEGEIVYVGSTNGKVYALKTDGGDLVWEQDVGGNVRAAICAIARSPRTGWQTHAAVHLLHRR
jgi:outer membrane protein assembly factor BamB